MEEEGYYQTKIEIMQQCQCKQHIVFTDYFDISVYKTMRPLFTNLKMILIQQDKVEMTSHINNFLNNRILLLLIIFLQR